MLVASCAREENITPRLQQSDSMPSITVLSQNEGLSSASVLMSVHVLLCFLRCCSALQAVSASTRAPNAADVLKMAGIHFLDADLADTVLSLRVYQ
jgi:hypothetical protein